MALIGLDIGHGSNTFPSNGKGVYKNGKGYAEHDFNSKLGVRVKELLEANGHEVLLGQEPFSAEVGLTKRTNLYNSRKVDLVVSLHANANGNTGVEGRCVFYWHTSNDAKRLAQEIVKSIQAKGYSTHGNGLHASMRGSWTNLHITRETAMPAVLIEHGFMTNPDDFELIFGGKQDEYVEDMAQADVQGILNYLGEGKLKVEKPAAPKKKENQPKAKKDNRSVEEMADAVLASGKTGNQARADFLGLTLAEYEPVRQEINARYSGKKTSAPKAKPKSSVKELADKVLASGKTENKARADYLGMTLEEYEPVRQEINSRFSAKKTAKPAPKAKKTSSSKWTHKGGQWTGQVLREGHYGPQVKQLQEMLAKHHFYPEKGAKNNGIDSYYGANTKDAVERFQTMNGLKVDGIAGRGTYNKLK